MLYTRYCLDSKGRENEKKVMEENEVVKLLDIGGGRESNVDCIGSYT